MKIAAAEALAELAREAVPEEVAAAYGGRQHSFGPDYIIPAPFDPRLIEIVPGGRRGGDADRRRAKADRRHGRLSPAAARAAQPDRRR
jgi:malic enzyme